MDKFKILLVEDDPDDIELLRDAFDDNAVNCQIDVVTEGDGVILFLKDAHRLPDVIVLDLNLPKIHGRELMSQIKSFPDFCKIPLVVFTTSSSQDDIKFSYSMGVDKYLTKPSTLDGFTAAVNTIVNIGKNP